MPIAVSAGTPPQFSWDASCHAWRLGVQELATEHWIWEIEGDGYSALVPPVVYGVVPAGAHHSSGPVPTPGLVKGERYHVSVYVSIPGFIGEDEVVGRDFSP
jgi:hypothetical protein